MGIFASFLSEPYLKNGHLNLMTWICLSEKIYNVKGAYFLYYNLGLKRPVVETGSFAFYNSFPWLLHRN